MWATHFQYITQTENGKKQHYLSFTRPVDMSIPWWKIVYILGFSKKSPPTYENTWTSYEHHMGISIIYWCRYTETTPAFFSYRKNMNAKQKPFCRYCQYCTKCVIRGGGKDGGKCPPFWPFQIAKARPFSIWTKRCRQKQQFYCF